MPTILTPQGWVKVAPPPPRKKAMNHNPKAALRGPLAYLACQQQTPALNVGGGVKGKAPFPYDLGASPEKLKRQSQARTVSAPAMHGALRYDENIDIVEPDMVVPSSRSKSRSKPYRHRDDDNHSVTSSSSSSTSRASEPTSRSYTRHRPVEARPHPSTASHDRYLSAPRYDHHYAAPPPPHVVHVPMPMPPSNGRSLSYSWYNATTPLNFN